MDGACASDVVCACSNFGLRFVQYNYFVNEFGLTDTQVAARVLFMLALSGLLMFAVHTVFAMRTNLRVPITVGSR